MVVFGLWFVVCRLWGGGEGNGPPQSTYYNVQKGILMDPKELRAKFMGVIAFPITPFKKDLSLDTEGLRKNLRKTLEHPPCALVAAGGTGEAYSLLPQEHLAVVKACVEEAGGRVPVIAGAAYNTAIGVELARQAAAAGAAGILAFPRSEERRVGKESRSRW